MTTRRVECVLALRRIWRVVALREQFRGCKTHTDIRFAIHVRQTQKGPGTQSEETNGCRVTRCDSQSVG